LYYNPYAYAYPSYYPVNPPPVAWQFENQPPRVDEQPAANDRATNRQAVALAAKFIGYGDKQFALKKYADALDRYRKAVQAAPQLADGYFRQGFAQTALGRYEIAAKAFNRGLEFDPKWPQSGFKLEVIFGDKEAAKNKFVEDLVTASDKNQISGDLAFLAGIHLYFDGQKDRAKPFFTLAAKIIPNVDPVNAFLRDPAKEEE
jgi:tetratricopeptide (TPR) repeat protein